MTTTKLKKEQVPEFSGNVTKEYVDSKDEYTLEQAKSYTDTSIDDLEEKLDDTLMKELTISSNASTDTIEFDKGYKNLKTGIESSSSVAMPVASEAQAGVINTAIYNTIQDNASKIDAILKGSVVISNLPETPTQNQLTDAWKTATGLTELINTAMIYDQANEKTWTYYSNANTWYEGEAGGSVTVNTATNASLGIVKGEEDLDQGGKIFIEPDGSMSVISWDSHETRINNNKAALETLSNIVELTRVEVANKVGKPVKTDDIKDEAVTHEKINLASFVNDRAFPNEGTVSPDDIVTIWEYTIPQKGCYAFTITATLSVNMNATNSHLANLYIATNNTGNQWAKVRTRVEPTPSPSYGDAVNLSWTYRFGEGEVVKLKIYSYGEFNQEDIKYSDVSCYVNQVL